MSKLTRTSSQQILRHYASENALLQLVSPKSKCKPRNGNVEALRNECMRNNVFPNPELIKGLRQDYLCCNMDQITDIQLKSLLASLPKFKRISRVVIWGKHFTNEALYPTITESVKTPGGNLPNPPAKLVRKDRDRRYYNQPRPYDMTESEDHIDVGSICLSRNTANTIKLVRTLSENISNSKSLREIRLVGIKFSKKGWDSLANSLKAHPPITYFAINYCEMGDKSLSKLTRQLKNINSLRKLDFSNNTLRQECGFELARIINSHSEVKNETIWMYALRNEVPSHHILQGGIEEICLANNQINDKAIFQLSDALYYDIWLRSLDLRKNQISIAGVREINSVLKSNRSLLFTDLRLNIDSGTRKLKQSIFRRLMRNWGKYKKSDFYDPERNYLAKLKELREDYTETQAATPDTIQNPKLGSRKDLQTDSTSEGEQTERHKCKNCTNFERALFKSENQCMMLALENRNLKRRVEVQEEPAQQSIANQQSLAPLQQTYLSQSGFSQQIPQNQPESMSIDNTISTSQKNVQGGTGEESGILHKIEILMSELTCMMDRLEISNRETH